MHGYLILAFALTLLSTLAHGQVYEVKYKAFTVWLDCDTRSAVGWKYIAGKHTANYDRSSSFYLDPNIPSKCQQTSTSTYKTPNGSVYYDRGHLVPANAMDSDMVAIKQSNIMTNVLPQAAKMNRGSWLETERWVECRRDIQPVTVLGGVYTGTPPAYGDFSVSHGVIAPEAYWKIAYYGDQLIAWFIPNSPEATANMVDTYIVTVAEIEQKIGRMIDVPIFLKDKKPYSTNAITAGCSLD